MCFAPNSTSASGTSNSQSLAPQISGKKLKESLGHSNSFHRSAFCWQYFVETIPEAIHAYIE